MLLRPVSAFLAARAMYRLTKDPTRLEEVFAIADRLETPEAAAQLEAELKRTPEQRRVFEERPRVGRIDIEHLKSLPAGTLGREFAEFLLRNQLDPADIVVPGDIRSDFDYARAHLRETHDIWHVATGFRTDVAGELGLQAFYLAQFRATLAVVLLTVGMLNTLFYSMDDREARMDAIVRGWLLGKRARALFGFRWAERWNVPLEEVRRELGIDLDAIERAMSPFVRAQTIAEMRAAA